MNETIAVQRAKRGDGEAFEALVTQYEQKVYSLAYHYAGNEHDAMDISQEVFLRVYRFLPQFNEDSRFSTWLYRVTSNVCKDYVRKKNGKNDLSLYQEGGIFATILHCWILHWLILGPILITPSQGLLFHLKIPITLTLFSNHNQIVPTLHHSAVRKWFGPIDRVDQYLCFVHRLIQG